MTTLVAGVDSSTQSCKVVIRDAETGRLIRQGSAPHPAGTEVDPAAWWAALQTAMAAAGGLDDVAALSVGGQQHGLVCLDADGEVIRPALLWNDTRSATAAADLVHELGGPDAWAASVGSVPVASFTVTKLRWLADHEPENLRRVAAVALPHDWLTWKLAGSQGLADLVTDRSEASGTGYFDAGSGSYRRDLLGIALRDEGLADRVVLPRVLGPADRAGTATGYGGRPGLALGPGAGDNAAAALGLGLRAGQTSVSIGTSGVVASVSATPVCDGTGTVAGFADVTGGFLPLACTLNGSRILDSARELLGVGHEEFSELALAASPGAGGLVYVPYLEGERTPNLPHATGSLHGMTLGSVTRSNLARTAVEGLLCLLADALGAVEALGAPINEVTLIGGGARSEAVRRLAPAILGVPVVVPEPSEYVADGAARQAAWVLSGGAQPPVWHACSSRTFEAESDPTILDAYRAQARKV